MQHDFTSPLDGTKLHRNIWLPEGRPKAMIVFAHGMLEHSGRHGDWAERFAMRGVGVVAADARGHGRSEGRRAWVGRFDDFLADYAQNLRDTAAEFPGVPRFAMGFSMGGAIATLTALTQRTQPNRYEIPKLSGLILVAPAIRFRGRMFPALRLAASVLDHCVPRFLSSKVWVAQPNFSILSRNKELVQEFRNDPLVHHGQLLLHFGTEILRAMSRIQNQAAQLDLPLIVLQGTSDWVVTPSGAAELVDTASSPDKTLRVYDGFYHDLLHEPERDGVLEEILDWIASRSAQS